MKHRIVLPVLSILMFLVGTPVAVGAQLKITYPANNSHVSGEVVEITGVGADPSGELEVQVLTNKWYLQDGKAEINADGSWSFAPCNLSGKGIYNNHTIKVTVIKNRKHVRSDSVRGIVRD